MNLIKDKKAPAQDKQLSLSVFKDKMMDEVHQDQEKGGSSAFCIGTAIGAGVGYLASLLDSCHD